MQLEQTNVYNIENGYPAEVGALFTTISSIMVSRVGMVRVTLTVTVRVSVMVVSGIALNKYCCE